MYVILPTNDVYIDEDALALVAEIGRTPTLATFLRLSSLSSSLLFLPSSFFILHSSLLPMYCKIYTTKGKKTEENMAKEENKERTLLVTFDFN